MTKKECDFLEDFINGLNAKKEEYKDLLLKAKGWAYIVDFNEKLITADAKKAFEIINKERNKLKDE